MYLEIGRLSYAGVLHTADFEKFVGKTGWATFDFADGEAVAEFKITSIASNGYIVVHLTTEKFTRSMTPDELAIRIEDS